VTDALRLAVSNIAWEPAEDGAVGAVLRREGATGVEIAPTKWRERPLDATTAEIAAYRRAWEDRGLRIASLQSLLFDRPDLQLFGDTAARVGMSDFLRGMIDLAAGLGAHALVFGSPKNRIRGELPLNDAAAIAADFLRELGAHAHAQRTAVCIEANPAEYGCDFITTTEEAVELCRAVDHPGIRVNGDLGGITLSNDDPIVALRSAGSCLAHFHASEPLLAPLGASSDHARAAEGLARIDYDGWVSIEMRASGGGNNIAAIERAVRLARSAYS
jgi:D-psicose/D-tagatose/L-ribulose 3-epimerase